MSAWNTCFKTRTDLRSYGDNAIGLFALALRFGIDDLDTVAADAITDRSDDKKCDIVHIDRDEGYAVVMQCYMSSKAKDKAPANKASDLNTAIAWLLQRPLKELPERIVSAAQALREAITDGSISTLHIWYVHNLPESKNVKDELITVEATARNLVDIQLNKKQLIVACLEFGDETFTELYEQSQSPILVNNSYIISVQKGYEEVGPNWSSFVTTIPAQFLHRVYKRHKTNLFSANVRDYLGSRLSDSNINNGIKRTAESDHENFWAYNNGVTILVNNYTYTETQLYIQGMSIVNGAQTTGAIGSLSRLPGADVKVLARFVKTDNVDIIQNIIRYNNSQNKVTASDFRSTDKYQKKIKEQISKIPNSEYEGGRRGGFGDVIKRRPNLIPSYTAGQALAAMHGDPIVAYNGKSSIWIDDKTYSKYFNEHTTGAHVVFAYSLLRSIEAKKMELINKSKKNESSLTGSEEAQLAFFRRKGAIYLYMAAVSACLESFLGKKIPNKFRLSFGDKISPRDAQKLWDSIVNVNLPLCTQLESALTDGLKSNERVNKATDVFKGLVEVTVGSNKPIYSIFAGKIIVS